MPSKSWTATWRRAVRSRSLWNLPIPPAPRKVIVSALPSCNKPTNFNPRTDAYLVQYITTRLRDSGKFASLLLCFYGRILLQNRICCRRSRFIYLDTKSPQCCLQNKNNLCNSSVSCSDNFLEDDVIRFRWMLIQRINSCLFLYLSIRNVSSHLRQRFWRAHPSFSGRCVSFACSLLLP